MPERSLPAAVRDPQLPIGRFPLKKNLTLVGWISRLYFADPRKQGDYGWLTSCSFGCGR
jgi:hypothetical protein